MQQIFNSAALALSLSVLGGCVETLPATTTPDRAAAPAPLAAAPAEPAPPPRPDGSRILFGRLEVFDPVRGLLTEQWDFNNQTLHAVETDAEGRDRSRVHTFDALPPARIAAAWERRRALNGGVDYGTEYIAMDDVLHIYDQRADAAEAYDFGARLYYPEGTNSSAHTLRFDELPAARVDAMWNILVARNGGRAPALENEFRIEEQDCTPDPAWPPRTLTSGEKELNRAWFADRLDLNVSFIQFCANKPRHLVADAPVLTRGFRIYGRENFSGDYAADNARAGIERQATLIHEWGHKLQGVDDTRAPRPCKIYAFRLGPATAFKNLCDEQQVSTLEIAFILSKGFSDPADIPYLTRFRNWKRGDTEKTKDKNRALLRRVISQALPHLSGVNLGEAVYTRSGDTLTREKMINGSAVTADIDFHSRKVRVRAAEPDGSTAFESSGSLRELDRPTRRMLEAEFARRGGVPPEMRPPAPAAQRQARRPAR